MSNTDFTEKAMPDVGQPQPPSPPPPPPPDPSAIAADLGGQLGGGADRPRPPSLRPTPWSDALPVAEGGDPRQTYMRRRGPVHPRDWGQADYILQGAQNYPGVSPGPWMPQVNDVSPLVRQAVQYLTQHGSGPVQAFAANMGLGRAAYDKAFVQGQIARAKYEQEQYAFNQKQLKDRMEQELRAAGSLFAEYADDPNQLRQQLIQLARQNQDPNHEHMVANQNLDDVKKHLDEMNGYYSDLGKIESQRLKDEWYRAQIEKIHADIKGGAAPPATPAEPEPMVTEEGEPATPETAAPDAESPDSAPLPSGDGGVPPPDESAAPPPAAPATAPPSAVGGPPAAVSPPGAPTPPATPETPPAAAGPTPGAAPAAPPARQRLDTFPKFPAPTVAPGAGDQGAAAPAAPTEAAPAQLFPSAAPEPGAPAKPSYPQLKVTIPPAQAIPGMSAAQLEDWGRQNYESGALPNPQSRGAKPFNDWREVQNQAVAARGEQLRQAEEQLLRKVPPINPGDDVPTRIAKTENVVKALGTIDPNVAARVGAILRGDLPAPNLTGFASRNPLLKKLGDIALRLDPGFTDIRHETNKATNKLFITGWAGNQRVATNRALEHADTMLGYLNKLPNTNFTLANGARAKFYQMLGQPEYTQFQETWGHVAQELTRAFRGSAGALGDINREIENVNQASSPDQVKGALRTIGELLKGQQDAMADLYSRGTYRRVNGEDLLAPEARASFHELMTLKDSQGRSLGPVGNISSDFGREPGEPSPQESQALEWLKTNSSDPRAEQIRKLLRSRGLL